MKKASDSVVKIFISIIGFVVIVMVLKELEHIIMPFVLAYLIYFLFSPLNDFLMKKKIPMWGAILVDLFLIIFFFWGVIQVLIDSFSKLAQELPFYTQKLDKIIVSTAAEFGLENSFFSNFKIKNILSSLDFGGLAESFFASTVSIVSTTFLIIFFFIFIVPGHKNIMEAVRKRYVSTHIKSYNKKLKKELNKSETDIENEERKLSSELEKKEQILADTVKKITEQIQKYIVVKFLISLATAVAIGIVLWLFNVDFIIVWAFITLILNFIPNIGSAIAVLLPTLMALVQFESFGYALLVAAISIVVQNIFGNILEPKIFGDRLGINPIVILLSLLLWGYIWGIIGMILSVPLMAIVKIIISNSDSKNLKFISDLMSN